MHYPNKRLLSLAVAGLAACSLQAAELTGVDVGSPSIGGSTTFANGKYTIAGGGGDIWNNSDAFHYAYMMVTGDFDYVVKVESLVGNSGDGGWSKAELMARLPLDPSDPEAVPDASDPHISNMTTRPSSDTANGAPAGVNYRGPQWRPHRSGDCCDPDGNSWTGASTWTAPNPAFPPNMPDNWMRLERIGSVFYMYTSNDGVNWSMYNPYDPQGWDTAGSFPTGTDNAAQAYFTNAWPSTIFLGLAVTSHNDGADPPTVAVFSNFGPYTPIPVAIATQPPATLSLPANNPLTISVTATGDPVHYEWRKDGKSVIVPGSANGMGRTYTIPLAKESDSGKYTVRVYGGGREVISSECVVTVVKDVTPPTLVKATGDVMFTAATVEFSEPVTDTALATSAYSLSPSVKINSVIRVSDRIVRLLTDKMAEATDYTLTVNNVQDTATPPNTIAANSKINFPSFVFKTGYVMMRMWDNVTANTIAGFTNDTRFPDNPTSIAVNTSYEWGPNGSNEAGSNYGNQLICWFMPAEDAEYIFFTCSDDPSTLYLSTDADPANIYPIAQETGWSDARKWATVNSGTTEQKRSDQYVDPDGNQWPDYPTISLKKGQKYYMMSLHTEGGGGDNVGATFIKVGDPDPADGTAPALTGDLIGVYADPRTFPPANPVITTQPPDSLTLAPGASATISVVATGQALTYQWQYNGRDIPGATGPELTLSNVTLSDIGQYWVRLTAWNGDIPSTVITSQNCALLVTATGVFNIEAEDFDFAGGQTKPEASVMPYKGGAYAQLSAVYNVDYHNTDLYTDSSTGTPPHGIYRYDPAGGSDLEQTNPNTGVNIADNMGGRWGNTRGGEFTMNANYKIGWIASGDWGNYTRTFPTPPKTYNVFVAQSYDGSGASQLNSALGVVTAGVGSTTQTVQPIGTFDSAGSQGWSRNNLVPMRNSAGALVPVELGGTKTMRWTYNSGDADYLLFVPFPAELSIGLNFGADEASGSGSGTLAPSAVAGAPAAAQANWNNLSLLSGSASALVADADGVPYTTSAQVTWTSSNTWSSTGRGEENNQLPGADKTLMTGYLDTGAATTTSVTVTGIPPELAAGGYDVYVYLLGGVPNKGGGYRILNAADQTVLKDYVHAYCSVNPTAHVEVTGDPAAYNVGTYIVFKGLKAPGIIIEATTTAPHGSGSNPRAPINAVQLSNVTPSAAPGPLTISMSGGNVTINWQGAGVLQSASVVTGPYTDVTGATSPYSTAASAAAQYFRTRAP